MSHKPIMGRVPHIYADKFIYFLTARTVDRAYLLDTDEKKKIFIRIWNNLNNEYEMKTIHWILWSNHYHAIVYFANGMTVPKFINRLHSVTALLINRLDSQKGRHIWDDYWDHCMRNEVDFWKHFNYITNNPIKHGWCNNFEDAFQYPFAGTKQWIHKKGKNFLYQALADYPIINFIPEEQKNKLKDLQS